MRDCASCVVDDVLDCRDCLTEDLLRARVQGDQDAAAQLEYCIHLREGVLTAVTTTITTH